MDEATARMMDELAGVFHEDPQQVQELLGFGGKRAAPSAPDVTKVEALKSEVEAGLAALIPGFRKAHGMLQQVNTSLFKPTEALRVKAEELARLAKGTKVDVEALVKEATFLAGVVKAAWTLADAIHDVCDPTEGEHTVNCVHDPVMDIRGGGK